MAVSTAGVLNGTTVTQVGKVTICENDCDPSTTAFTPDGRTALVTRFNDHKVSVLAVDGTQVTYTKEDISSGPKPYPMEMAPDGTVAVVSNVGNGLTGGADTLKVGGREIHGRAYVASFNFKGSDQQKKVGELSGGERNRVHLAKLLKSGGNVLLLDEPTNDLDVDTLRALEEALEDYAGCAVIISHDRWFLDRIATHILAFEGDSQVVWFEGNYQDYEADRKRRLGAQADQPHRIKYRKLTR